MRSRWQTLNHTMSFSYKYPGHRYLEQWRAACLEIHWELAGRPNLTAETGVGIQPSPTFGKIAEGAGDAWWGDVERADEADGVLEEEVRVVRREGRLAVMEVGVKSI